MVCSIGYSLLEDSLICKTNTGHKEKAAFRYSLLERCKFRIEILSPLLALLQSQSM